jgi:hypothetical protein
MSHDGPAPPPGNLLPGLATPVVDAAYDTGDEWSGAGDSPGMRMLVGDVAARALPKPPTRPPPPLPGVYDGLPQPPRFHPTSPLVVATSRQDATFDRPLGVEEVTDYGRTEECVFLRLNGRNTEWLRCVG